MSGEDKDLGGKTQPGRRERMAGPRLGRPAAAAFLAMGMAFLGACSSVPEELDVTEIFDSDEPLPEISRIEVPPDTGDGSYPNLATVPARPPAVDSFRERQQLQKSLARDYGQANYSTQPLRSSVAEGTPSLPGLNLGPGPALVVLFEPGQARLTQRSLEDLERIAVAQSTLGGSLRVIGYAGGAGESDPLEAFRLSAARAEAIADRLQGLGIPAASIVTQAVATDRRRFGVRNGGASAEIFLDIGTASR